MKTKIPFTTDNVNSKNKNKKRENKQFKILTDTDILKGGKITNIIKKIFMLNNSNNNSNIKKSPIKYIKASETKTLKYKK